MEDNTRKKFRRCIVRIPNYWGEHFSVYYPTDIRIVPESGYDNWNRFYYNGKYKKDIVYAGLNIKVFVKFLMDNKNLKDGKLKFLIDIRK